MAIHWEGLQMGCGRIGEELRSVHSGSLELGTCFGIQGVLVEGNLAGAD